MFAPANPTSEERTIKKALPSNQTNQEARLTTNNNYSPYMKRRVRAATYTCKHTRSNAYQRQYEGSIMIQRKPCSEDCQCNQAGKHRMQDANLRHLAIVRRSMQEQVARTSTMTCDLRSCLLAFKYSVQTARRMCTRPSLIKPNCQFGKQH